MAEKSTHKLVQTTWHQGQLKINMVLILNQIKISKDKCIFIVQQKIKLNKNMCSLQAAPGPVTALASFPGSGNTWLRYLLQQVDDNDNHDDDDADDNRNGSLW